MRARLRVSPAPFPASKPLHSSQRPHATRPQEEPSRERGKEVRTLSHLLLLGEGGKRSAGTGESSRIFLGHSLSNANGAGLTTGDVPALVAVRAERTGRVRAGEGFVCMLVCTPPCTAGFEP